MGNYTKYLVLLLICVLSRLISTIYYIEDPDSLRFALCVYDQYDLASFQPHFPGYPVFCFIVKILYFILGNFPISFSLIGGVALYFIIYYILKLLNLPLLSLEGVLIAIFIFFNPMIWILSNRFMPDLAGVAVMIAAFYYLVPETYRKNDIFKGWFLMGILAGLRLSYLPFLIIPSIYSFLVKKNYFVSLLALILGVVVWLIPMIIDTGSFSQLVEIASRQTAGYFYDFGGTFLTEGSWALRFWGMLQSIWADGLGGFWPGRNFALLFNSLGILSCGIFGFMILLNFDYPKSKVLVLFFSCCLYLVWVFLFQNIIYNSHHVIPLIPFLSLLIAYGIIYFLVNFNFLYVKVLMLTFVFGTIFLTVVLAVQHTYPTAIAQVREYVFNKTISDQKLIIVSDPLINNFLKAQKVDAEFISVGENSSFESARIKIQQASARRLIMIGDLKELLKEEKPVNVVSFQHNPYVNNIWPELEVYEYILR